MQPCLRPLAQLCQWTTSRPAAAAAAADRDRVPTSAFAAERTLVGLFEGKMFLGT